MCVLLCGIRYPYCAVVEGVRGAGMPMAITGRYCMDVRDGRVASRVRVHGSQDGQALQAQHHVA